MRETTLCYIQQDNRYLMLHRTKKRKDPNEGKWIGVGGGLEPGETPEECLLREVLEETGLTLTQYTYRGLIHFLSDTWESEEMHLYTAREFIGQLHPCDEGELAWIERTRLFSLPMWEGDRIFLKLLEESLPFFELTLNYRGNRLSNAVLNGNDLPIEKEEP